MTIWKIINGILVMLGTLLSTVTIAQFQEVVNFISKIFGESIIFKKSIVIGIIVFGVILSVGSIFALIVLFNTKYLQKDNAVRKRKETWVRHVETIGKYQYEIFNFIWDLEEYKKYPAMKDKELLFKERIIRVWMMDNQKFNENMNRNDNVEKTK